MPEEHLLSADTLHDAMQCLSTIGVLINDLDL